LYESQTFIRLVAAPRHNTDLVAGFGHQACVMADDAFHAAYYRRRRIMQQNDLHFLFAVSFAKKGNE